MALWVRKRLQYDDDADARECQPWQQLHYLFAPFADGPRALCASGAFEPAERGVTYSMVVVDEAHHIYANADARQHLSAYIAAQPSEQELFLLSDASQASHSGEEFFPKELKTVELTQVVRSSKNIVSGAQYFQAGAADTQCLHESSGPPLKSLLVDMTGDRMGQYAQTTLQAMCYIKGMFPGLVLKGRLAILVPDFEFLAEYRRALERVLQPARGKDPRLEAYRYPDLSKKAKRTTFVGEDAAFFDFDLVDVQRSFELSGVIVDTIGNFDGLERLIVIAVGLDSEKDGGAPETRSRLYRGITRANMMAVVVNHLVKNGWLEFLTCFKFNKDKGDGPKRTRDAADAEQRAIAAATASPQLSADTDRGRKASFQWSGGDAKAKAGGRKSSFQKGAASSRRASEVDVSHAIVKQGRLKKLAHSTVFKRWQPRFFVLQGRYLKYYESEDTFDVSKVANLKGTIDLSALDAVDRSGAILTLRLRGGGSAAQEKLRAAADDEAGEWAAALEQAAAAAGGDAAGSAAGTAATAAAATATTAQAPVAAPEVEQFVWETSENSTEWVVGNVPTWLAGLAAAFTGA